MDSARLEVLAGLIERVTYHNAENGFCVLRAKVSRSKASFFLQILEDVGDFGLPPKARVIALTLSRRLRQP